MNIPLGRIQTYTYPDVRTVFYTARNTLRV